MEASSETTPPKVVTASKDEMELRRGPWTVEEDVILINYIENHGEGRWNSLARCSGLKRTGKSCRLRWLNYLRPDVRRGNITPEEQLLILELHTRFGNRWSKIAKYMPGRTDNEIKNYWRTRVQKHAKQLQCDVSSKKFQDLMRYLWMPRLLERIRAASGSCCPPQPAPPRQHGQSPESSPSGSRFSSPPVSDSSGGDCYGVNGGELRSGDQIRGVGVENLVHVQSPGGYCNSGLLDFEQWDMGGNLWNVEDIWF